MIRISSQRTSPRASGHGSPWPWKGSKAGLAEEVLSYPFPFPFNEREAEQLVKAIPKVREALSRRHYHMLLEMDRFPWQGGGFWYFHLYTLNEQPISTLGWYAVNACSGEVWKTMPKSLQIRLPAVKKLRAKMVKKKGLREEHLKFREVDPGAADCRPCRDLPCRPI